MYGLRGKTAVRRPEDFPRLAGAAIRASDALRERVYGMKPGVELLRTLDSISQAICNVIDPAELCRHTHAQLDYREAASEAFGSLANYLNTVNTDTALCAPLKEMVHDRQAMTGLTEEQERMAVLLYREFELDGIHLPEAERARARELKGAITELETAFSQLAMRRTQSLEAPSSMLLQAGRPMRVPDGPTVRVAAVDVHHILRSNGTEGLRRQGYEALFAPAPDSLAVLDLLRDVRHKFASLLGFESHAHLVQAKLLVDGPDVVDHFLGEVRAAAAPQAVAEVARLGALKGGPMLPWDLQFYRAEALGADASNEHAAYFAVDNCLHGLKIICDEVFGVHLREEEISLAETWHPAVRRFGVTHPQLGRLGTIYLDLYRRDNKFGGSAHFAVACGCSTHTGEPGAPYQEPVVALVTSFPSPNTPQGALLHHSSVLTLFHEFGHALHSVLSRTEFQHLSGTRAQQDFVEMPSQLMEYFACDYRVLSRFAKHYRTGKPIPPELVEGLGRARRDFAGLELQHQNFFAELDQALFNSAPTESSADIHRRVHAHCNAVPMPGDLQTLASFDHVVGYGGSYYSYLYSGAFASQIWEKLFEPEPLSRVAGERLRKEVLAHGGAADPKRMLHELLGDSLPPTAALLKKGAFSS